MNDFDVRAWVLEALNVEGEIADDDDLIQAGLDSLAVMRLSAKWHARGVTIPYTNLIEYPTLAAWTKLVATACRPVAPARPQRRPQAPFRMAPMQEAYWIGQSTSAGLGGVHAHYYVELDGVGVAPARLESALDALQQRHEMLRIRVLGDGTQQVSDPERWRGLATRDLRGETQAQVSAYLEASRKERSAASLDLEMGQVFSAGVTLLPGDRTRVHLNIGMFAVDATSFALVLDELAALYMDPSRALPPVTSTFAEYLEVEDTLRAPERAKAKAYWDQHRADLSGPPQLPLVANGISSAGQPGCRARHFDGRSIEALRARSQRLGVTLSTVFATAYAEVVAQWSAERRFVLNVPVFDRQPLVPDIERVVGDFTSVCLVDIDFTEHRSFLDQARDVQLRLHRAVAQVAYSGVNVLRDLARDRGGPVLAPVVFTSALSLGDFYGAPLRETLGEPIWTSSQTPQVWLDCQVTDRAGGVYIHWDVVEDLFSPGVVEAMFGAYVAMLLRLAEDDDAWMGTVASLLPASQRRCRDDRNQTATIIPDGTLADALFDSARAFAPQPALVSVSGEVCTFGMLQRLVLLGARMLLDRGVRPGELVGVSLPSGTETVVAALAVMSVGAVYVPVGLEQPRARRDRIWQVAGVSRVITTPGSGAAIPAGIELVTMAASGVSADPASLPRCDPRALAYVVYTSGSTGEPKGVEISHRSALNTIVAINRRIGLAPGDRVLGVSAIDFDLSIWDMLGPIVAGAALVPVRAGARRDPDEWASAVERAEVTVWNSVPALLEMLLNAADGHSLESLRVALLSGDWIPADLPRRLRGAAPRCKFLALGGATEAAIWSNAFDVEEVRPEWRSIPYGYPLPNQRFRVVDPSGRDRPDWVRGEMWIGGEGVALGYRNDPKLSSNRFPESGGERWYRTGDWGRYWPDGTLEFLGRVDRRIKHRGNRIELGEIEAAAERHATVQRAIAGVVHDQLALAVEAEDNPATGALLDHLRTLLPASMVPSAIFVVPDWPLTSNGKVDRAAMTTRLSSLVAQRPTAANLEGSLEREIARVWSTVLGREVTARDRTFFQYGGDSLRATNAIAILRRDHGVHLSLRELLSAPTVAGVAGLIESRRLGVARIEEGEI